jgi:hypothetical protein
MAQDNQRGDVPARQVNAFDRTDGSGSHSRDARVGVVPQRQVHHHRPEVRAADANVDDGLDALIEARGAGQEDQQLERFPGQGTPHDHYEIT